MPSLNPRLSGRPRTAALMSSSDVRVKLRAGAMGQEPWQQKVIDFDRDGPGVLGYYLDTVALLASLCPLTVEERDRSGAWSLSKDPVLAVALAGYRSTLTPQSELVSLHVRHREGVGECWVVFSDDIGWCVATVPNVTVTRGSDVVEFVDAYGIRRRVPGNRAWKSWDQDKYEPWRSTSPVRRALPDLRRLKAATRNQMRTAESRLATNGLLAFPPDEHGARPLAGPEAGGPAQSMIAQIIDDYIELARESFNDDDSPAAAVPFPYEGPAAQYVDLGRSIDTGALQVEDKALEAFARAVNFPAQLLVSGPGAANHWNEWVLQEVQHRMGLAPKMLPVCADITEFYLRPMVRMLNGQVGSWNKAPDQVRVGFDMTFLTQKPDVTGQMMEAYRLGIVTRDEVAERLGIATPAPLPIGLTEYEHWELATGSKGAPYAEVDAENRLLPPPAMPGGDPFGAAPPEEPPPEEAPAEEEPPEESTTDTQAPPEAPVQAALAAPPEPDLAAFSDALATVDLRLEAQLSAIAAAARTAAAVEVAKELLKALPPRSPEREALRGLSPEAAWLAAPPEVRQQVPVAAVAERAVARFAPEVQAAFSGAQGAMTAAWEGTGFGVPEVLVAAGVAVLGAYVVGEVTRFFTKLGSAPVEAGAKAVARTLRGSTVPVRAAMAAAAGALRTVDDTLAPTQSGTPATMDGIPWEGGAGTALGHNSAVLLKQQPGLRLRYKWRHGFFGQPETPFPPHVALNGTVYDDPAATPGGFYPGDHPYCTCHLAWSIERTQ